MTDFITNYMRYHPVRTQRGLEVLTGLVPWSFILFLFMGSYFLPETVAYAVIGFNIYWLYRSLTMSANAVSGYLNIQATQKTDWLEKLKSNPETKNVWGKYYHVVLICNVKEKLETLRRTLDSLAKQTLPKENLVVVLAMEAREEEAKEKSAILTKEYRGRFGMLVTTYHPLTPGETIGKHSNEAYAAKEAKKILVDQKKIPIENITITTSDADSVFPNQYFALLAYKFLTVPDRYYKFFQAPQFPFNNIDKVTAPVRIAELASGISQISGLKKYTKRYFVVSTYSTSLVLLDKVGYCDVDAIPEDWHINLKAYFALQGKVDVVPLFLVVSIDAAQSTTAWKTIVNRYKQVQRQAWGATDVPYVIKQFFLHPEIPFWDKMTKITFVFESHLLWSVNWFILTIGANIPTFHNQNFARTSLGFNLSRMSALILTLCLVGLLTIIVINTLLDPGKQQKAKALLHPFTYLPWVWMPIAGFFLNALPGLESQTRLMLGRYIEYRVTEKV